MKKANLNGPQDKTQEGGETFQGAPKQEGVDILEQVKRKAKDKIKELFAEKKEQAVFEKCSMTPGMSWSKLKDKEKK
jgi:hypothetical protein